ncbi:MarR family winged helix-turn-helix transcriptional regulator [Sphingomonas lenta]|uniref:MarR family transcriptional regulator n=1 Tax=Sphingomonas lenta TaxID=1141887 RepID=A0A2A2SBX9_9SPHN|nr:MarR family transcriptional regulator [Sphingomonas lenta]PAX06768.1 MarR family transcriptional regulator [Sphingomonas lenta]
MSGAPLREKHDGALAGRDTLRLWLRLLSCTTVVEKEVKRRLSQRFGTTLPRFDVLAALDRRPEGMTLSALSRALLVSNGNVTGLAKQLGEDGLVAIEPLPGDRRASLVRLTEAGAEHFAQVSAAHHEWIDDLLGGLSRAQRSLLFDLLGALKVSIAVELEP